MVNLYKSGYPFYNVLSILLTKVGRLVDEVHWCNLNVPVQLTGKTIQLISLIKVLFIHLSVYSYCKNKMNCLV